MQLGLRGDILKRYATEECLEIVDMTPFVIEQRENLGDDFINLVLPKETTYLPKDEKAIVNIGLDRL